MNCFAIGFNHHHSNISERSYYAISNDQLDAIYAKARDMQFPALTIINTCNRTELYGQGDMQTAIDIYTSTTFNEGTPIPNMMKLTGSEAVEHIFKVCCGLDSQIIGDLEILGQFKKAFQTAKQHQSLNGYFERLGNLAVQAAKEIRTSTDLSGGTVSLSYAVVKLLRELKPSNHARILLIGTGDFGKGIAQNIKSYCENHSLVLTNRTERKSIELANKLSCDWIPYESMLESLNDFDVIITSVSNQENYLITKNHLSDTKSQLLFDLSVPQAIDPQIQPIHRLISIDEASKHINQTLEKRKSQLPLAYDIIYKFVSEFNEWNEFQKKSESIKTWKSSLIKLTEECPNLIETATDDKERIIGRKTAQFVHFIKENPALNHDYEAIRGAFFKSYPEVFECIHLMQGTVHPNICTTCRKHT